MTQRVQGAQLRLIKRGERITAAYLGDIAAAAERNAKKLEDITTESPEGEDGEGALDTKTYTEDATRRETSLVRIEDDTDPSVFIEINRIDRIVFVNDKDGDDVLDLNLEWPP